MVLVLMGMRVLEAMFFVGFAGSVVVVILSIILDIRDFSTPDVASPAADKTS